MHMHAHTHTLLLFIDTWTRESPLSPIIHFQAPSTPLKRPGQAAKTTAASQALTNVDVSVKPTWN
jgi:hypothetical protein